MLSSPPVPPEFTKRAAVWGVSQWDHHANMVRTYVEKRWRAVVHIRNGQVVVSRPMYLPPAITFGTCRYDGGRTFINGCPEESLDNSTDDTTR
jgi:hypothetical protein